MVSPVALPSFLIRINSASNGIGGVRRIYTLMVGYSKTMRLSCLPAVFLAFLSGTGLRAENPVDAFIDALSRVRKLSETALSPDGTRLAWVQSVDANQGFAARSTAIFRK